MLTWRMGYRSNPASAGGVSMNTLKQRSGIGGLPISLLESAFQPESSFIGSLGYDRLLTRPSPTWSPATGGVTLAVGSTGRARQ